MVVPEAALEAVALDFANEVADLLQQTVADDPTHHRRRSREPGGCRGVQRARG